MVCEHIHSVGGFDNIDVSNSQLLLYCASTHHKYLAYLEDPVKNR